MSNLIELQKLFPAKYFITEPKAKTCENISTPLCQTRSPTRSPTIPCFIQQGQIKWDTINPLFQFRNELEGHINIAQGIFSHNIYMQKYCTLNNITKCSSQFLKTQGNQYFEPGPPVAAIQDPRYFEPGSQGVYQPDSQGVYQPGSQGVYQAGSQGVYQPGPIVDFQQPQDIYFDQGYPPEQVKYFIQ